jgi:hypothetical protein
MWEKAEKELIDRGLVLESLDWPERAKHWFFAHGGRLDLETRKVVYGERIQAVAERFHQARSVAQSGEWQPNRDKDELTYALRNPEDGGRTRGYGSVSWGTSLFLGCHHHNQTLGVDDCERNCFSIIMYCI